MTEPNREEVKAAATAFRELSPGYIVCPENAKAMEIEILRLVEKEGHDPASIRTYQIAFANLRDQLHLNEPTEKKQSAEMTPEELFQLSEPEKDKLPARDLKRLAEFELRQRQAKPSLTEDQQEFKALLLDEGFGFTPSNCQIVATWLAARNLASTLSNLRQAVFHCENELAPSEEVLNSMSSDEYRKVIVEPQFRKRQAEQSKRESLIPFGVKTTEYLHNP